MTTPSALDSMEALLASCNDVLPSTLNAARDDLKYIRVAEQRARNWRRAELLQVVCALAASDESPSESSGDLVDRSREKVAVAMSLLKALDEATDEEPASKSVGA